LGYGTVLTRDDLLSAADEIAAAGGSPDVERRLRKIATSAGRAGDVAMDLVEDVLVELQRLVDSGRVATPTVARALTRRFERGLLVAARTPVN